MTTNNLMVRSTEGSARRSARLKVIFLANMFFDDGFDLSEIATKLNCRRFRQEDGTRLNWKNVADLIHERNFEV